MNTTTEEIAAAGVRERLAKYQNQCKTKTVKPMVQVKEVGSLEKEMTDGSKFIASPSKVKKKKVVLDPKKLTESNFSYSQKFDFDPSDSDTEGGDEAPVRSSRGMVNTLRPGLTRGSSFDEYGEGEGNGFDDIYGTTVRSGLKHPRDLGMRPGMFRGDSFEEPPPVTEEEEAAAKDNVVGLINSIDSINQIDEQNPSFVVVKDKYLTAIETLRPESIDVSLHSLHSAASKSEIRQHRKQHLRNEKCKMDQYEDLKSNWIDYETVAQDKPEFPSEVADDIQAREENVSNAWTEFAEQVVEDVQDNSDSESDDDDDDLAHWIAEAKRLKAEKDRRNKAKRRVRREMRKESNAKLIENEDEDIIETARRLKAEADAKKAKKGVEKETIEDKEDDGDDDSSIDDIAAQLEKKKGQAGSFLDSSDESSQDSGFGLAKSFSKLKGNNSNGSVLSGSMNASQTLMNESIKSMRSLGSSTRSQAAKSKKKGNPSAFLEDSEGDEESDDGIALGKSFTKTKRDGSKSPKGKSGKSPVVESENTEPAASPSKKKKKGLGKKKKAGNGKAAENDSDSDSDVDESQADGRKKSTKKKGTAKKRKSSLSKCKAKSVTAAADDESSGFESSDSEAEAKKGNKKKGNKNTKTKAKSQREERTAGTGAGDKLEVFGVTPLRNLDGSEWRNVFKAWLNTPKKVKIEGTCITVRVPEKTDCWRKTRHNFIMDNAPFYWHKVAGDFEIVCKISGTFSSMYDKAGIMIRLDEENWATSGMECFNGVMNHSTCITQDYTDWSLAPLPENAEKTGIWFALKRIGDSIESFYSLEGKKWIQTRQGIFNKAPILKVGVVCACPMGENFKVNFDMYRCKNI